MKKMKPEGAVGLLLIAVVVVLAVVFLRPKGLDAALGDGFSPEEVTAVSATLSPAAGGEEITLDIPAGELRFKKGGGNAGHNGLKSITQLLGTPDFYRLRIGIGRPPQKGDVINWVLGRPCSEDADKIRTATDKALEVLEIFAKKGLEAAVRATRS